MQRSFRTHHGQRESASDNGLANFGSPWRQAVVGFLSRARGLPGRVIFIAVLGWSALPGLRIGREY